MRRSWAGLRGGSARAGAPGDAAPPGGPGGGVGGNFQGGKPARDEPQADPPDEPEADAPSWKQQLDELASPPAQNWSAALRALRGINKQAAVAVLFADRYAAFDWVFGP